MRASKRRSFLAAVAGLASGLASMRESPAASAPLPKDDVKRLVNAVVPFAEQMLKKYGEYYPIAAEMAPDGKITQVATYDGDEHPLSADLIRTYKRIFVMEAKAGKCIATALAYDVRVTLPDTKESSDAIACNVDHRDGYSFVVYFPYRLVQGEVVEGETFAVPGAADIFPQANSAPATSPSP